jgi:hypothetical protein
MTTALDRFALDRTLLTERGLKKNCANQPLAQRNVSFAAEFGSGVATRSVWPFA